MASPVGEQNGRQDFIWVRCNSCRDGRRSRSLRTSTRDATTFVLLCYRLVGHGAGLNRRYVIALGCGRYGLSVVYIKTCGNEIQIRPWRRNSLIALSF